MQWGGKIETKSFAMVFWLVCSESQSPLFFCPCRWDSFQSYVGTIIQASLYEQIDLWYLQDDNSSEAYDVSRMMSTFLLFKLRFVSRWMVFLRAAGFHISSKFYPFLETNSIVTVVWSVVYDQSLNSDNENFPCCSTSWYVFLALESHQSAITAVRRFLKLPRIDEINVRSTVHTSFVATSYLRKERKGDTSRHSHHLLRICVCSLDQVLRDRSRDTFRNWS